MKIKSNIKHKKSDILLQTSNISQHIIHQTSSILPMNVEADFVKEALDAGLYKQAVTVYLQLLKSMCKHFVEDEHYCYFDDMYSPEYTMQWIYEAIQKHEIDAESQALLDDGHKEILQSECYEDYGVPSYIDR